MALNKTVLIKLNKKTKGDKRQQKFLVDVFDYEFSSTTGKKGWYKEQYEKFLKDSLEEKQE